MTQNVKQKNPNPQGKGLVPVLAALANASAGIRVLPKHVEQVSTELFTALFILESQFSFKPVRGRDYWLYRYGERFKLSLVAPTQWSVGTFDQVIGCCVLHADLTWTLTLSEDAAQDVAFMGFIAERRERFQQMLHDSASLEAALPVYQHGLPFYQRVFASALASSLGQSMQMTGIAGLRYEQAQLTRLRGKPRPSGRVG